MASAISSGRRFLFIHPQKTGGSSVYTVLRDLFDDGGSPSEHAHLRDFKIIQSDYFKFMTTRNPWDRCVSLIAWHKKSGRNHSLRTAARTMMPLSYFGAAEMDYILRFEHLTQDFAMLCGKLGLPARALPHHNASEHGHRREYFTEETRQIVAERFAEDIERFGYEF